MVSYLRKIYKKKKLSIPLNDEKLERRKKMFLEQKLSSQNKKNEKYLENIKKNG